MIKILPKMFMAEKKFFMINVDVFYWSIVIWRRVLKSKCTRGLEIFQSNLQKL